MKSLIINNLDSLTMDQEWDVRCEAVFCHALVDSEQMLLLSAIDHSLAQLGLDLNRQASAREEEGFSKAVCPPQ